MPSTSNWRMACPVPSRLVKLAMLGTPPITISSPVFGQVERIQNDSTGATNAVTVAKPAT